MRSFFAVAIAVASTDLFTGFAYGNGRGDVGKVKVHQEMICGLDGLATIDIDSGRADDLSCTPVGVFHVDKWFRASPNSLSFSLHDVPKANQAEVYQQCRPNEPSQPKSRCIIEAIINEEDLDVDAAGRAKHINHFYEVHVKKVSR